jgi:hypothetical protein
LREWKIDKRAFDALHGKRDEMVVRLPGLTDWQIIEPYYFLVVLTSVCILAAYYWRTPVK